MTDNFISSGGSRGASQGLGPMTVNQNASPVDQRGYDIGPGGYGHHMQGRDGGEMLSNEQMMGGPGPGSMTHQMRGMNLG